MTTAEVLAELGRRFSDHEAMWQAIQARRSANAEEGRFPGSAVAAHEVLEELLRRECASA
jgi:hypothetical protein